MRQIHHLTPFITSRERKAVNEYMKSGGFMTEYKVTEKFESELAKFLGVKYVSLVPSGTSALYLSLLAAGIGPGDKVLVPDFTMIADVNAVRMVGAEPVLVDIDIDNLCLYPLSISYTDLKKVKAMIYVDINGRSGDMHEVRKFCKKNDLTLIEDACQALGSEYQGKKLGTFGRFGCFSLGFHKIITTGQGGFIVTKNRKDYEAIERLKDFGRIKGGNDVHDYLGFNFKYTDLQAVIGLEQLKNIEWRMAKKRRLYKWYWNREPEEGYVPWFIEYWGLDRSQVKDYLLGSGIQSRKLYPPINSQKIYGGHGFFPITSHVSLTGLWLPSSLDLTKDDVEYIKNKIREVNEDAYL